MSAGCRIEGYGLGGLAHVPLERMPTSALSRAGYPVPASGGGLASTVSK